MKKLFIAVAFLIPVMANAQTTGPFNYKVEDRYLYYGDVVQVATPTTVPTLYKNAKSYLKKIATDSIKITADDPTGGIVAADLGEQNYFIRLKTGVGDDKMTLLYSFKTRNENRALSLYF